MSDRSPLDTHLRDHLVATVRGATSFVPVVGGILGEVISAVIPGQRLDRLATYLERLAARVAAMERGVQERLLTDKPRIDLIEEGGHQAARALSDGRIDRIVDAVTRGIVGEDADIVRRGRLLRMFGELDDDEMLILNAFGRDLARSDPNAWDAIDRPDPAMVGATKDALDRSVLYEAGQAHLLRLGLLRMRDTNLPQTIDFRHGVSVTPLGRLLLQEIGLPTPVDVQKESRRRRP